MPDHTTMLGFGTGTQAKMSCKGACNVGMIEGIAMPKIERSTNACIGLTQAPPLTTNNLKG